MLINQYHMEKQTINDHDMIEERPCQWDSSSPQFDWWVMHLMCTSVRASATSNVHDNSKRVISSGDIREVKQFLYFGFRVDQTKQHALGNVKSNQYPHVEIHRVGSDTPSPEPQNAAACDSVRWPCRKELRTSLRERPQRKKARFHMLHCYMFFPPIS